MHSYKILLSLFIYFCEKSLNIEKKRNNNNFMDFDQMVYIIREIMCLI